MNIIIIIDGIITISITIITTAKRKAAETDGTAILRHRLNGYLAHRVPSIFLANSFAMCSNREVLKGTFPWRTRYGRLSY